jgi:hypothetical protein
MAGLRGIGDSFVAYHLYRCDMSSFGELLPTGGILHSNVESRTYGSPNKASPWGFEGGGVFPGKKSPYGGSSLRSSICLPMSHLGGMHHEVEVVEHHRKLCPDTVLSESSVHRVQH